MAKRQKSQNPQKNPNLDLLTHKYSRIFIDNDSEIIKEDEEGENYKWYDTKRVFYPYYKARVQYKVAKALDLHPILIEILSIINELERLQDKNNIATLNAITQLDSDIFNSILGDLEVRGHVEINSGVLKLSKNGKELLRKRKERVVESSDAYVCIDGIFGDVVEVAKNSRDINLEDRDKNCIELKPKKCPRMRTLHEEFKENLSLEQVLRERLGVADDTEEDLESGEKTKTKHDIVSIDDIKEPKKFFKSYFCLFYKSKNDNEKILVINEKYEIDREATKLFEDLIDKSQFDANNTPAYKENKRKFETLEKETIEQEIELKVNLTEGHTFDTEEHKTYFLYTLKNAKNSIYIGCPWVTHNVLKEYKDDIESALEKGVKVFIKYGLKPRNKHDKIIDSESKKIFSEWEKKYENFRTKTDNNHSKFLICDREFMINGSFNWLSFKGEADKDGDMRKEMSSVVKNLDSIEKAISSFKQS